MDERLNHIADGIETTCKMVSLEIQADCRLINFRRNGTIIDLDFVVGEKYGNREWVLPIIEPQPINWGAELPQTTTDFRTVRYQAVRVVGPVHHPIPHGYWKFLAGELVSEFLNHQPD